MENVSMLRSEVHRFYMEHGDEKTVKKCGIPVKDTPLHLLDAKFLFDSAINIVQNETEIAKYLWSEEDYSELNVIYKNSKNLSKMKKALEKHKIKLLRAAENHLKNESNNHISLETRKAFEAISSYYDGKLPAEKIIKAIEPAIMIQRMLSKAQEIFRNNIISEGEETFISFLYFVYMTRGGLNTDDIGTHKVIVVDDPICSLDSSILYVVSSLVRELTDYAKKGTNNIDQVFILTHNVYFHKEVSFMDGRDKTDNKVSFWTLQKKNEISTVKSYNNKNPITTSYALLWKEVKNSDSISSVSLQNAMRRILENFFGTLGNANFGDILKCFASPEEQSICRSLFSWTNDGSHSIPDDLEFSEDNDSSEKFKKVFRDVFYNTHNQYHYDRMME